MSLNPPSPELSSGVFTTMQGLQYDSTAKAFKNGSGTLYYAFVQKVSGGANGATEWACETDANAGMAPRAQIPQTTYDIIAEGSYNQDGTVGYKGKDYRFALQRNTTTNVLSMVAV
jgi:hypothetical protein